MKYILSLVVSMFISMSMVAMHHADEAVLKAKQLSEKEQVNLAAGMLKKANFDSRYAQLSNNQQTAYLSYMKKIYAANLHQGNVIAFAGRMITSLCKAEKQQHDAHNRTLAEDIFTPTHRMCQAEKEKLADGILKTAMFDTRYKKLSKDQETAYFSYIANIREANWYRDDALAFARYMVTGLHKAEALPEE